ncbi:MAG: TIGR00730 family Rossman fold protein [Candidatus Babeliales bacterium]
MRYSIVRNYGFLLKNIVSINTQLIRGVWSISRLPEPRATVFGGTHVSANSYYARQAHVLSHKLAQAGISVITGGGPGIMYAASCGVTDEEKSNHVSAKTLGITVAGLEQTKEILENQCLDQVIVVDHFLTRKWLMMNFSIAFAVFPGGFGTLDELAEVAMMMQLRRMPGIPLILISKAYWQPLMDWFSQSVYAAGLIKATDMQIFRITDDIDEAFFWIAERCELCNLTVHGNNLK